MIQNGKRPLIVGVIFALLGALFAFFGIFDVPHTIALVTIIVAVDYLIAQGRSRAPAAWPGPPLRFRGGARTEVARLAWATTDRQGNVSEKVLQRVRLLAQKLLAPRGVSWDGQPGSAMSPGPLARQLLGAPAVATLTTAGKVRPKALQSAVSQLEKISKLEQLEKTTSLSKS